MTSTTAAFAAPSGAGARRGYWSMWPRTGREILAIIALFVIACASFSLAWGLFSAGLGLLAAFLIGVFVIIGALYLGRAMGTADLAVLEWAGMPTVPRPAWPRRPGFWGWLRSLYGNPHYWLYLLHTLLPQFVLGVASFTILMTCVSIALGGTFWFTWAWAIWPLRVDTDRVQGLAWVFERWGWVPPGDPTAGLVAEGIAYTLLGLVFLALLPFVTRGLAWAHWGVARGLLGGFRSEALEAQLAGARASRAAAVAAEDSAIRRIERDIHDGPQQRLVRLQMDLASAERRLAADPAEARELISSASQQAREALEELRAVSRGIAPPILLDRGLVAALESAALRSTVPVVVTAALPEGLRLAPELERNAYFIASEAMTNAAKHAGAEHVSVRLGVHEGVWLFVEVVDDGRGGATSVPGHGLAGLADRAQGLGGTFTVTSPPGGPTTVLAWLPVTRA